MAGGATRPVRGASAWASSALVIALVAVLVAAIATVLWMWARTIAFPYPVDYG